MKMEVLVSVRLENIKMIQEIVYLAPSIRAQLVLLISVLNASKEKS